jgi:hypothetical protein
VPRSITPSKTKEAQMRWFGMTWGTPRHTVRRPRPPAWVEAAVRDTPAGDDDDTPPLGCAWFDSSHELRTGLLVREMQPGPELQLLLWTQAQRPQGGTVAVQPGLR